MFGGYVAAGGKFGIILAALPFEMLIIGGSALGTFLMANSMGDVKHTLAGFGKILKGARYTKSDYVDMLSLLFFFVRLAQSKGAMALEPHIEKPEESPAFAKFPKIAGDHHAVTLICDYLRMVGMNADDPHQIEDVMARELKKVLAEELHPSHALQIGGGRAAGARHRRRGARRHQDHGEHRPAAGGARQDDRRRAGRHLPRRAARLRHDGALRRAAEGRGGGGSEVPTR